MLFISQAANIVQQMYQSAIASTTTARKEEAAKRLSYYHDEQSTYIYEKLKANFADPAQITPAFCNIVKKIVNNLAMTYISPAAREIEGTEQDKKIFAQIVDSAALDMRMKTASRYVKLLKSLLLRPVWRNNRLDLDILTPDILDVKCGDTPENLKQVMITHYPESGKQQEITYTLWDAETVKTLDYQGRNTATVENPYGVLPFVPLWDRSPTADFFQSGGDDLICLQEAISEKLTDLLYVIRFQGFGVGYTTGFGNAVGTVKVGAGTLLTLPEGGTVGYAQTHAPILEIVNAIDRLIKWACVSNGLSAASMSTEPTEESGVSKIVGNRELDELRLDDMQLFRIYEKRLFDMMRIVWNTHNNAKKISDSATLKINFYDPRPALSAADKAKQDETELTTGIISPVDLMLEKDPDIKTREEALQRLMQIKEETRTLTGTI